MWKALLIVSLFITICEQRFSLYKKNATANETFNKKLETVSLVECTQHCEQEEGCTTVAMEQNGDSTHCYTNNKLIPGSETVGTEAAIWTKGLRFTYLRFLANWPFEFTT